MLLRHVHRWGDVHLVIDQVRDDHLQRRLTKLEGRLPSLHVLRLTIMEETSSISLEAFKSAPRLRYLQVKDSRLMSSPPLPTGWPWDQITHLSASLRTTWCLSYHTLATFTHLLYLRLKWSWWDEVPSSSHGQIIFQACKFLHVELYQPSGFVRAEASPNLLKLMDFPVLEKLFICYVPFDSDQWVVKQLGMFVHRHATKHLQSFHWYREITYYSAPLTLSTIYVERVLFDHLKDLPVLRLTLPSQDILKHILTNLKTKDDFMPGLRKLDVKLDTVFLKDREVEWITELLRGVVASPKRRLDEIRLQIPPAPPRITILPWELVLKLDGWEEKLRADWKKQTTMEGRFEILSLESQPRRGSPVATIQRVGDMSIQVSTKGISSHLSQCS